MTVLLTAALLLAQVASLEPAEEVVPFTAEDTLAAIEQASAETGVSYGWLYSTVGCETGWTWNPYSVGRQGELGPAQLHPRGELRRFYAVGYSDPYSPYESIMFMAQRFAVGGSRAWSCA